MTSATKLAEVGAAIGDPARSCMLLLLLDGRRHSASNLASAARVSAQTASWHLAKLADARLVAVEKVGRNRFFRISSQPVALALESLLAIAASGRTNSVLLSPNDAALRNARTCYDHLAGKLGVALTEALSQRKLVLLSAEAASLTRDGAKVLTKFGIDIAQLEHTKRFFCRPCMDWSEQRPHLAGALGAALAARCFDLGWFTRQPGTRALSIEPSGYKGLKDFFGVAV
jgi:DNA-binding transcriptional ArsR family regulator